MPWPGACCVTSFDGCLSAEDKTEKHPFVLCFTSHMQTSLGTLSLESAARANYTKPRHWRRWRIHELAYKCSCYFLYQCKKYIHVYWGPTGERPATDDRPTTDLTFGKISTGHISARGRPIHFMFGSRWGFPGRRIEWRYFRFRQIQDGDSAAILENSNGDISAAVIRFTPCLVLGWGFWGGRSSGAISGLNKFNRYVGKTVREE